MHYNGPIDIVLHPKNQINAYLHIKHCVVPCPLECNMLLLASAGVRSGCGVWGEILECRGESRH